MSLAVSCVRLEIVKEKEETKCYMIRNKFRSMLLAFQKGMHKAKKVRTTRKEENKRDWAELNIELLHLISKKIENISNFINFRAVCKDWRLATDPTDAPVQFPWFICSTVPTTARIEPRPQTIGNNEYFVYSLSSNAILRICLPENNKFVGTSAGFVLVLENYCSIIYFLNPLTGTKVTVPSWKPSFYNKVACLGHVTNHNLSFGGTEIYLLVHNEYFPTETMRYQFVRFQPPDTIKHILITVPKPTSFGYYKERLFLSLSTPKITWVYDASTGSKTSIEIPHPGEHVNFNFLIDAMGDLLGVMMSYIEIIVPGEVFQILRKYQFEVYRLEHTDDFGCCRWSKLNGIGDRILFLHEYYYNYGFCLRASDIKGLRGNYIYYKTKYRRRDCANGRFFRYDMEDGTTKQLVLKSPEALWFLPSLY